MEPLDVQDVPGVLLVPFTASKERKIYYILKRVFDIIIGIIGVILLIPISIVVKIASIINGDFAPIFFIQERIGQNGKKIKIYKFRSMVPNGEMVLEELMDKNPKIKEEYLTNKKLENDPRITKVGNFLRKTSIDEFPQFINVLKGEMSLVGPRPYLLREIDDMGDYYETIIKCKPGITGLWQVSGRSDVSFSYRLKMDKLYLLERSLVFDINIILRTFKAVLLHKGAK